MMFLRTAPELEQIENYAGDLSRYWELEQIGMKEMEEKSADDHTWYQFKSTVKVEDNRYQVCWPWKNTSSALRDNYGFALGRLKLLLNRIQSSPWTLTAYADVFQTQLSLNIIEEAPQLPSGEVFYMPHHAIISPGKATTKLRVVFDASSKSNKHSASLNECFHRGPVLLEELCGLLLRFRTHPIALVGDLEKAFLQIGLQETERDVTLFLWVKDPSSPPVASVKHHMESSKSEVSRRSLRDIYVDNVISGEKSDDAAVSFYDSAKQLFRDASMNIREWYSNSNVVMQHIPVEDRGSDEEPVVLGLKWNLARDTLRVPPVKRLDSESLLTKRRLLKALPQLFDPCGMLAPVTVTGELMVQDLWARGLDWDEPVPSDVDQAWKSTVAPDLLASHLVERPRLVKISRHSLVQLHALCDASRRVCAAAIYIRVHKPPGTAKTTLLMSKTRLSPIRRKLTIPRLKLVAATLGARLLAFVDKHLGCTVSERFCGRILSAFFTGYGV